MFHAKMVRVSHTFSLMLAVVTAVAPPLIVPQVAPPKRFPANPQGAATRLQGVSAVVVATTWTLGQEPSLRGAPEVAQEIPEEKMQLREPLTAARAVTGSSSFRHSGFPKQILDKTSETARPDATTSWPMLAATGFAETWKSLIGVLLLAFSAVALSLSRRRWMHASNDTVLMEMTACGDSNLAVAAPICEKILGERQGTQDEAAVMLSRHAFDSKVRKNSSFNRWNPLGLVQDASASDDILRSRQPAEVNSGRVLMLASTGYILPACFPFDKVLTQLICGIDGLVAAAVRCCTLGQGEGSAFVASERLDSRAAVRQHGGAAVAAGLLAPTLLPALAIAEDTEAAAQAVRFVEPSGSPFDIATGAIVAGLLYVNIAPFFAPSARARHILFKGPSAQENAQEALATLAENPSLEEFAAAAMRCSSCPSAAKGGDLGSFKKGRMVPEFDAVVFDSSKPLGEPLGPIKTNFGYHLIWVEERS